MGAVIAFRTGNYPCETCIASGFFDVKKLWRLKQGVWGRSLETSQNVARLSSCCAIGTIKNF